MTIPAPGKYRITIEQSKEKSPAWLVRVYRRRFLFKKRISSDWFLDPDQASRFAAQAAEDLHSSSGIENLKLRQPGWVLHRVPH